MSKLERLLGVLVLGFAVAIPAVAEDKKPQPKADQKKAAADQDKGEAPDMAAMMAMYEEMAKPGPQHEALKALAGSWKANMTCWMDPNAEPMKSTGTAERKMVLGGRYLHEEFVGTFMDKPFAGFGVSGYDNLSKKFVSSWIDSWSTGMMTSSGTADASFKTFTYKSDQPDPMSGMHMKHVLRIVNNDKHIFEMFMIDKDGKETKSMEIEYTRK
jgi:hypothetical protein